MNVADARVYISPENITIGNADVLEHKDGNVTTSVSVTCHLEHWIPELQTVATTFYWVCWPYCECAFRFRGFPMPSNCTCRYHVHLRLSHHLLPFVLRIRSEN